MFYRWKVSSRNVSFRSPSGPDTKRHEHAIDKPAGRNEPSCPARPDANALLLSILRTAEEICRRGRKPGKNGECKRPINILFVANLVPITRSRHLVVGGI